MVCGGGVCRLRWRAGPRNLKELNYVAGATKNGAQKAVLLPQK
jgi:hypothetical protein